MCTLVVHPLIICLQRLVSKVHYTFASVSHVCHIIKISDVLSKAFYYQCSVKGVSHEQRHTFLIFTTTERRFCQQKRNPFDYREQRQGNCHCHFLYTRTRGHGSIILTNQTRLTASKSLRLSLCADDRGPWRGSPPLLFCIQKSV